MTIFKTLFYVEGRKMVFNTRGSLLRIDDECNNCYACDTSLNIVASLCGPPSKRTPKKLREANLKLRCAKQMFRFRAFKYYLQVGCQEFTWGEVAKVMALRRLAMRKGKRCK